MRDRGPLVAIAVATLLRLALAPLRILSPDEAYYLAAARRGVAIADHPPVLRLLLALFDRLPGPVELRVRSIAALLAAVTALGVVSLAEAIAERRNVPANPTLAAVLASFGLMGFAGGMITTPDAPFLAATIWLFVVAARGPKALVLAGLAAVAVASKVAALAPVLAIALALVPRNRAAALALVVGALAVLPFAVRSLLLQAGHAIGRGALVSAPYVGPLAALGALLAGAFFLYSPPVLVRAARARGALAEVPGARLLLAGLTVLLIASALVSGRPPEPNWIAPAMLPLLALASVGEPMSRAGLALHMAPTVIAVALFVGPDWLPVTADPLARTPHARARAELVPLPGYAVPAWRCVYDHRCEDFDAFSRR
jgi:hypothetical protein